MRPRAADRRKTNALAACKRTKQGIEQGVDGNKRVKGRTLHVVVDTLGMVLNCFVSAVNMADVKGAKVVLAEVLEDMVRVEKILADQAYKGELAEALEKAYHCILEVIINPIHKGYIRLAVFEPIGFIII